MYGTERCHNEPIFLVSWHFEVPLYVVTTIVDRSVRQCEVAPKEQVLFKIRTTIEMVIKHQQSCAINNLDIPRTNNDKQLDKNIRTSIKLKGKKWLSCRSSSHSLGFSPVTTFER